MLRNPLRDTVIVNYILDQPIVIPYIENDITQLTSFLSFDERGIPSLSLHEELQEYMTYPDPSQVLPV